MKRTARSLVALCVVACVPLTEESPPPAEAFRSDIVKGASETGEPAVVYIRNRWTSSCTATVIAPRVALTAKHCIQGVNTRNWSVLVGPRIGRFVDRYNVVDVRTTPGKEIENKDIAVLILDRDFTQGRKRWAVAPVPDFVNRAEITAMGYGMTYPNSPQSSGTKYRRDGQVLLLGPQEGWELGDSEFMTLGENTCQGDSGGPLLYRDIVVGVVSRGEETCEGFGVATRVSSFADMIKQALNDTGSCVPQGYELCNGIDDDCWNGPDNDLGPTCACSTGQPSEEVCDGIDNDCNDAIDDLPNCGCRAGRPPSTEVCDGVDNDCNGEIDEVCVSIGESCSADDECRSQHCALVAGERVCTAHCTAGPSDTCPDESFCEAQGCGAGLCRPVAAAGLLPEGAECSLSTDCESRFCSPGTDDAEISRCRRPCQPGAVQCFATEVCLPQEDQCGQCISASKSSEVRGFGEPCLNDGECLSGYCFSGEALGDCGAGCPSYCTVPCEGGACPEGGYCRGEICVRGVLSELGEGCLADADCREGNCMVRDGDLRCAAPCGDGGGCEAGFQCLEETCWPVAAGLGDVCVAEDQTCLGGWCALRGDDLVCSTSCKTAGDCPAGLLCVAESDGSSQGLCLSSQKAFDGTDPVGAAGCSCRLNGGPLAGAGSWWAFFALVGWCLIRRFVSGLNGRPSESSPSHLEGSSAASSDATDRVDGLSGP